jgi:nucleoside-diphosphate-sugar epimerase
VTLLLTGGTGYLGGRLARRLVAEGREVRLLVRDPGRARAAMGEEFGYARGDLATGAGLKEAVAGCREVVHTAALVKNWVRHPAEFEKINVAGAWALCEAALEAGVTRFVYTSSFFALGPSPDGRPVDESALFAPPPARYFNDYHSTKARAARLLRDFLPRGLPLVTLIPTVVYGPGAETDGNHVARILRLLQTGRFPGLLGGGLFRWNLACIDDVVEGHVRALERGAVGGVYILGGHDVPLRDLARSAAAKLGRPEPKRVIPWGAARAIAAIEEGKARLTGIPPRLTRGEVEIYRHEWVFTSALAERDLGYRVTPLDTAVDATIAWLKATR